MSGVVPLVKVFLPPAETLMPRLQSALYSGYIAEGEAVAEFEQRFGDWIDNPALLAFHSGTAALHIALILAGVRPGDDVVTTAMTAEPTNMAIHHAGARIVWADVDPLTGNVTGDTVAAALTPRTTAVVVVHYAGLPAPLDDIAAVARHHGVPVIEDAAHALGARYGGRRLGVHSDFVAFSFQAIKHITTVDGGALSCRDPSLVPRGKRLRWFGLERGKPRTEIDVAEVGYKYHMNNVIATIGLEQMNHIDWVISRHIENGQFFDQALQGIPGLKTCRPPVGAESSYWLYTVLVDRPHDFCARLAEEGISASPLHRRNDRHSVFASSSRSLPGLDSFTSRMVHIPCGWWVDEACRNHIVSAIRAGW